MSSSKPVVNGVRNHYDLSSSTFVEHLSSLPIVASAASTAYQYPQIENVSKTVQSGVNKVLSYTYDTPIATGLSKADGFATNVLDGLSDRVPIIKAPLDEISRKLGLTYLFNVSLVFWTQISLLLTKLKDIFAPLFDPVLSPFNHLLEKLIQSWLPSSTANHSSSERHKAKAAKTEFDRSINLLQLGYSRIKARAEPRFNYVKKTIFDLLAIPESFYKQNLAIYVDDLKSRVLTLFNQGRHTAENSTHAVNNYGSSIYHHIKSVYSVHKPKENAPLADYVLALFKTVESLLKELVENGKKKAHTSGNNTNDGTEGQTNGLIGGVKNGSESLRKRVHANANASGNANGVPA